MDVQTIERIVKLEVQIGHLDDELANVSKKVDEMHAMLLQAKGFRFALIAFVGVVSFVTGTILPWFLHSK